MIKAFITVIGKDRVGIIAEVAKLLADNNINILDISQTILDGMFTMIMAVDLKGATKSFYETAEILKKAGEASEVEITVRHSDIFDAMHRIQ